MTTMATVMTASSTRQPTMVPLVPTCFWNEIAGAKGEEQQDEDDYAFYSSEDEEEDDSDDSSCLSSDDEEDASALKALQQELARHLQVAPPASSKARPLPRRASMESMMNRMANAPVYLQDPTAMSRNNGAPRRAARRGSNAGIAWQGYEQENSAKETTGTKKDETGAMSPVRRIKSDTKLCLSGPVDPEQHLQELLHAPIDSEGLDKSKTNEQAKSPTNVALSQQFWANYFVPHSVERQAALTNDVLRAVRQGNLPFLEEWHYQHNRSLDACNGQGDSLLHVACRRGHLEVVQFLVETAKVSLKCKDVLGKTPLHNVCWATTGDDDHSLQQGFAVFQFIVSQAPELLFCRDCRGHTPLQYVPPRISPEWCQFLDSHASFWRLSVQFLHFGQTRMELVHNHERLQRLVQRVVSQQSLSTMVQGGKAN